MTRLDACCEEFREAVRFAPEIVEEKDGVFLLIRPGVPAGGEVHNIDLGEIRFCPFCGASLSDGIGAASVSGSRIRTTGKGPVRAAAASAEDQG